MELKDKAIDIKGKKYVLVSDRVLDFNDNYHSGKIETILLSSPEADMVVFKVIVTPDIAKPERFFTGHSQATWGDGMVNKTAAMENAETSAVGRALGFMGIGVIDSIASADELHKAQTQPPKEDWKAGIIKKTTDMANAIPAADLRSILLGYGITSIEEVKTRPDAENLYLDIKARYKELQ